MRFQITMNMPSKNGSPVHQIIGESNVNSLAEFIDLMDKSLFVVVREIYRDQETGDYYPVGDVAINPNVIGKIKVFN